MTPKPSRHRRLLPATAVLASTLALGAGCGSPARLTAPIETMIELEATWHCEVTRFSFETAEQIEAKRAQIQERFGVSPDDHRTFVEMVEDDPGLREAVAVRNDELCPVAAS